jgi:hypothetical protein
VDVEVGAADPDDVDGATDVDVEPAVVVDAAGPPVDAVALVAVLVVGTVDGVVVAAGAAVESLDESLEQAGTRSAALQARRTNLER